MRDLLGQQVNMAIRAIPLRDTMPRNLRLFVPRGTYHAYCRVARGEYVFDSDDETIEFVDVLRRVRDLDGLPILAWCLMAIASAHVIWPTCSRRTARR